MNSTFIDDIGNDPVERIFRETPAFENKDFFVVKDIDQICDSHFLIMSKARFASMADAFATSPGLADIDGIALALGIKSWLYFERGRSPFCTSMRTANHAHGHLFNSDDFKKSTLEAIEAYKRKSHESLTEVLNEMTHHANQYLIFGNSCGTWYSIVSPSPIFGKKRFIREHLTSCKLKK